MLGALVAFGPLSMELYLPGMPSLARDLHSSASAAQLTITACMAGLAAGQLLIGPISDAMGRRRPLLAGIALYSLASLACALSPSIWALLGVRFVQGMAGAAGIVIARAMVRDLATGAEAARIYSGLMLITGLVPMLAPIVGGELLHVTDWRGTFVVLAAIGAALLVMVAVQLPETLLQSRRHVGGAATSRAAMRVLLADRSFVALVLCVGLAFATLTAYLGGAAFVLEDIHGISPQLFGLIVGLNAAGMVLAAQVSGRLVHRVGPEKLLYVGLAVGAVAGVLLVIVVLGEGALWPLLICLFLLTSRSLSGDY